MYREWAPAAQSAQLIGDFNGWQGTPLDRDDFGVWSVRLPDGEGLGENEGSLIGRLMCRSYIASSMHIFNKTSFCRLITWTSRQAIYNRGVWQAVIVKRCAANAWALHPNRPSRC